MFGRKAVNQRISDIIQSKGLKQVFVAKKAGLTPSDISRIVKKTRPVYADEIVPIAHALSVPIEVLVCPTDNADTHPTA